MLVSLQMNKTDGTENSYGGTMRHPYVIMSTAMSIDGCIDDTSPTRLILSNAQDFDRVDALRAECDAILVGAGTIRRDNPKLSIRSSERRNEREAKQLAAHPKKVTITASGVLDPSSSFFQVGESEKIVYCTAAARKKLPPALKSVATIVEIETPQVTPDFVLSDLHSRGIGRLLIEGGSSINSQFLAAGYVNEMRLAIAPIIVGRPDAARFVIGAEYSHNPSRELRLRAVEQIGEMSVLHYILEHSP